MKIILASILALSAVGASAQVAVGGHVTKDGVYVQPHQRTAPNKTLDDNYSTKGNTNPYTGKAGTVTPLPNPYVYTPPPPPPPVHHAPPQPDLYKPVKPSKF